MTPFRIAAVSSLGITASLVVSACSTPARTTTAASRDQLVAAPTCEDTSFPIYFETGSASLTAAAQQLLQESTAQARRCTVKEVLVLGLADADGAANRNLALSRQRADSVARALSAQGLPAPSFDIEAAGESGATTPSGRPEPLRRRAEVVIRAEQPAPTPPARSSRRR